METGKQAQPIQALQQAQVERGATDPAPGESQAEQVFGRTCEYLLPGRG